MYAIHDSTSPPQAVNEDALGPASCEIVRPRMSVRSLRTAVQPELEDVCIITCGGPTTIYMVPRTHAASAYGLVCAYMAFSRDDQMTLRSDM